MPLLYQYIAPGAPASNGPLPPQLATMTLLAKDPRSFNDPFEVRPYFDQERHNYFAKTHEQFYERALGIKHTLIAGHSMTEVPTENAVGFGEELNKRFRDQLGKRFRVVCLSRTRSNVLMWGHYTHSYRGFVIGIDTDHPSFPKGLRPGGFDITYSPDRSRTKLPLAYYQGISVESYDLRGNITNSPNQVVETGGGVLIPFSEYQRQLEEASITALTTKAQDWHYEQEVRFIYDRALHQNHLALAGDQTVIAIPPDALKEVIVGFRADLAHVRQLVRAYRDGRIGQPKLFYATCHPNQYEVQAHGTDDKYLLDYFQIILPSQ